MSNWVAKRFWAEVSIAPTNGGYQVLLDARPVRSPAKSPLVLPTRALAEAVAEEWRAVEDVIVPAQMPATRAVNSAIDKVTPQYDDVAAMIAAYGGSDLLCYRAEAPQELCEAQAAAWDPMLDWAARELGAPLVITKSVIPVAQPETSLARLSELVFRTTPFELTALHDLVCLTGSLVLGLAATRPEFDSDMIWNLSRFDENWQAERWGTDDEAAALTLSKRQDFVRASTIWKAVTQGAE
ncbi:MAG: ATP12 family protein [Albidovulum sp.]